MILHPCFSLRRACLSLVAVLVCSSLLQAEEKMWTYFGTYTGQGSKGIYLGEFDLASGELKLVGLAAEVDNPTFLAIDPTGKYIYAAGEIGDFKGKKAGAVSAFKIEPKTGKLTLINQQSSEGSGPCHVTVDKTGKCVLVANYGGGSVASLPVGADGKLGEAASAIQHEGTSVDKGRQEAPHAHSINVGPDNRFAFAADLGLDKILIYKLDPATAKLTPNDPAFAATPKGGGPRHFAFHPNGKYAYVCNEMKSSITSFEYNADKGTLTQQETLSTLPEGYDKPGNSTAEVQVHPSGKFVYVSNRGHDSIAIFAIDEAGKLTSVGQESIIGKTPRNFGIDPTGKYIIACGQDSKSAHVFKIDPATGKLKATGSKIEGLSNPVCVKFLKQ
jgi:6-phosphogluconolactonase